MRKLFESYKMNFRPPTFLLTAFACFLATILQYIIDRGITRSFQEAFWRNKAQAVQKTKG